MKVKIPIGEEAFKRACQIADELAEKTGDQAIVYYGDDARIVITTNMGPDPCPDCTRNAPDSAFAHPGHVYQGKPGVTGFWKTCRRCKGTGNVASDPFVAYRTTDPRRRREDALEARVRALKAVLHGLVLAIDREDNDKAGGWKARLAVDALVKSAKKTLEIDEKTP